MTGWRYTEFRGIEIRAHPDHMAQFKNDRGEWEDIYPIVPYVYDVAVQHVLPTHENETVVSSEGEKLQ